MASSELNVDITYIYSLCDPRDGRVRYIGKADNPDARLGRHLKDTHHCHRVHWIQSLVKNGLKPTLAIIQKVPREEWQFWERLWIAMYQATGHDLVNSTAGGDGMFDPSPETLAKFIGNKNALGHKQSPEERAKKSAALIGNKNTLGHKQTPEERAKHSAVLIGNKYALGHKQTPEERAKHSAALVGNKNTLGFKHTQETCKKYSIVMKARWALRRVQKQMTALVDQAREERNSDAS